MPIANNVNSVTGNMVAVTVKPGQTITIETDGSTQVYIAGDTPKVHASSVAQLRRDGVIV